MAEKIEDKKPFLDYINAPTKKDPRLDPSTDHDIAFNEIKGKGPKIKKAFEKKIKF